MKLSKILIPTLSIASVAAITLPMVSCNKTNTDNGITYQFFKDGQPTETYKAQVSPKAGGEVYKKATSTSAWTTPATIGYINDIQANPKILADDVLQYISTLLATAQYQNLSIGITNISNNKTAKILGDDVLMLSGTIKIAIEHSVDDAQNDKETATISFNNFIPKLSFDAEGKNAKLILYGYDSFEALSLTSSSVSFGYNYTDKDGNVITSFDILADTSTEAKALVNLISQYSSSIDSSITNTFGILNLKSGSSNAIPSAYFINQMEETK